MPVCLSHPPVFPTPHRHSRPHLIPGSTGWGWPASSVTPTQKAPPSRARPPTRQNLPWSEGTGGTKYTVEVKTSMSLLLWRNIKWSEDAAGEGFPRASVLILQIHEHSGCRGHRATSESKVTSGWTGMGWW